MKAARLYPTFPPGMWRKIAIYPSAGRVIAGIEDDVHRFVLRIAHDGRDIIGVDSNVERYPWSTCRDAGRFLEEQITGSPLEAVAALDPSAHCTHLIELAIVAAALAQEPQPMVFDMLVADRIDGRTTASLHENGEPVLSWRLDGTTIEGPAPWAGRDLRRLSVWRKELDPDIALRAMMLRRTVHISGVRRRPDPVAQRAMDLGPSRMGACFTYQTPRARDAEPSGVARIDFSHSADIEPLRGFDPETLMAGDWRQP